MMTTIENANPKRFCYNFQAVLNLSQTMNNYGIVVYWSEKDAAFIAEVPELAGCLADGET